MSEDFTEDYLLNKKVKIFQPVDGYRASSDAVLLAAMPERTVKNLRILDVGSGTGAVSLCLAYRLQKNNVQITGLELQDKLVELSNKSALANNFDFVKFYQADIANISNLKDYTPNSFDIVITNPPYSENDMPSPNISKAVAHNHKKLDLEDWLLFCLKSLKPFGKLYMINRAEALPRVCACLQNKAGNVEILPVYSREKQQAKRIIISAQKCSKSPCRILPPLVVHDANNNHTNESNKILRDGISLEELLNI